MGKDCSGGFFSIIKWGVKEKWKNVENAQKSSEK